MSKASGTALLNELTPYRQYSPLIEGIAAAGGSPSIEELADRVNGSWIQPGESVFTVWLLLNRSLVLHERSTEGVTFTLCVDGGRIRRVVEEGFLDGSVRVTLEIEADRAVLELTGTTNEEGVVSLAGSALSAGYTLTATAEQASKLSSFARDVRRFIDSRK